MNPSDASPDEPLEMIVSRLDQLIAAVINTKTAPQIKIELTLWNTSDVADYLGVTYKYASEYIVTHHTFPSAMRIPTKNGKKGHPRWYAGEVIQWVSSFQEK